MIVQTDHCEIHRLMFYESKCLRNQNTHQLGKDVLSLIYLILLVEGTFEPPYMIS